MHALPINPGTICADQNSLRVSLVVIKNGLQCLQIQIKLNQDLRSHILYDPLRREDPKLGRVLGSEPRALPMLNTHSAIELLL